MKILTPEITAELEAAVINGNSLQLTRPIGDRKLYHAVDKIIKDAGGRWNRATGKHLFPSDPRERLGLVLATGKSTSIKQELQAFYTQPELATRVVMIADVQDKTVLEPSAGHGALASMAVVAGARSVMCVEIDPAAMSHLVRFDYDCHLADFLELQPRPVDRVVMNPPFTKNQDIKHVRRALTWLAPKGRLVAIMAGNTERRQFQDFLGFVRTFGTYEILPLERGAFRESGTMVSTIILIVDQKARAA